MAGGLTFEQINKQTVPFLVFFGVVFYGSCDSRDDFLAVIACRFWCSVSFANSFASMNWLLFIFSFLLVPLVRFQF